MSGSLDTYVGLDARTGGTISGAAHLVQSLRDVLTTPIGGRVMRRAYGSRNPGLIDRPESAATVADVVASSADAVIAWEPRGQLKKVAVTSADAGGLEIGLALQVDGQALQLEAVA